MELTDSVAVVSGGSGAIGRAIVDELARGGADVVVGYHTDRDGATEAVERAESHGVTARAVAADVTDESAAAALVEAGTELGPVQAVVTCAGYTDPGAIEDRTATDLDRHLAVNVTGAANVLGPAVERMRTGTDSGASDGGAVVAVSSVAASLGTVDTAYAASKSGLEGYIRGLARELGPEGVRASVVAPGPVETPMNDAIVESLEERRFRGHETVETLLDRYAAQPAEVARAVRFLLGHEFVTGEVLHVDGGMALD
ncbi:SDR family NAD(P)-dependent oxidoreductase [Haloarcula halophila]|uniref:SDR family NAD(P)-dependent oxidoreductase n=1 Tax=Haloarcula TaxID=2237 RepID=UPI0023E3606B|nr:SDR family oxidoreductase [Halomicroarcula sp. DFY41]